MEIDIKEIKKRAKLPLTLQLIDEIEKLIKENQDIAKKYVDSTAYAGCLEIKKECLEKALSVAKMIITDNVVSAALCNELLDEVERVRKGE